MQETKLEIVLKFKYTSIGKEKYLTLDPELHAEICRWANQFKNEEASANFHVKSFLLQYAAKDLE